jgi:hypothetical protein
LVSDSVVPEEALLRFFFSDDVSAAVIEAMVQEEWCYFWEEWWCLWVAAMKCYQALAGAKVGIRYEILRRLRRRS